MPEHPPPAAEVRAERVALPGRETDVRIGAGLRHGLWDAVRERFPGARRCGLVADERVAGLWPLPDPAGLDTIPCRVPAGEAAKTRAVLADLQDRLLELRRDEPVVVLGGGATLDVGGFAAATIRRGLPWVALPTTVVGMADAAIGGKVAVNHPRGKNLLGTFHPPALVRADVDTLGTLDGRDRAAGLAEVYKCARIGDATLLAALRAGPPASPAAWTGALHAAVRVKARLVEADERDAGPRRQLNYGHTAGHALETLLGNEALRHGEAVAIGMAVAAQVAVVRGLLDESQAREQAQDLAGLGLPTALPAGVDVPALLAVLGLDKKRAAGARHTLALPRGACGVEIAEDVTEAEIVAALERCA